MRKFKIIRPWYLLKLHLTLTRNLLVQNELAPSLPRLCAPNLIVLPREERISVYEKIWLKDLPLSDFPFFVSCYQFHMHYLFRAGPIAFSPATIIPLRFQEKFNCFANSLAIVICLPCCCKSSKSKPGAVCEAHAPISIPVNDSCVR